MKHKYIYECCVSDNTSPRSGWNNNRKRILVWLTIEARGAGETIIEETIIEETAIEESAIIETNIAP